MKHERELKAMAAGCKTSFILLQGGREGCEQNVLKGKDESARAGDSEGEGPLDNEARGEQGKV